MAAVCRASRVSREPGTAAPLPAQPYHHTAPRSPPSCTAARGWTAAWLSTRASDPLPQETGQTVHKSNNTHRSCHHHTACAHQRAANPTADGSSRTSTSASTPCARAHRAAAAAPCRAAAAEWWPPAPAAWSAARAARGDASRPRRTAPRPRPRAPHGTSTSWRALCATPTGSHRRDTRSADCPLAGERVLLPRSHTWERRWRAREAGCGRTPQHHAPCAGVACGPDGVSQVDDGVAVAVVEHLRCVARVVRAKCGVAEQAHISASGPQGQHIAPRKRV
jgi:hypothetical protein